MPGAYGYPASCENVISVGATDIAGARAYYSTFNNMVDIAAPGGTTGTDLNGDGVGDGVPLLQMINSIQAWQGRQWHLLMWLRWQFCMQLHLI